MKLSYRESNGSCCRPVVAGLPWRGKVSEETAETIPLSGELFLPGCGGFHYCPDCLYGHLKNHEGEWVDILIKRIDDYHAERSARKELMDSLRSQLPDPFASMLGCDFWIKSPDRKYRIVDHADLSHETTLCHFGHDLEYSKAIVTISEEGFVLGCIDNRRPSLYERIVGEGK